MPICEMKLVLFQRAKRTKPFYRLNWKPVLIAIALFTIQYSPFTKAAQAAEVTTFTQLLQDAQKYNGQIVVFQGEAIGDIMVRQDAVWINVRDETGAIGVFCPRVLVNQIKYRGDYNHKGDIISVKGLFQHACTQHGGDSDIHAQKLTVIQEGRKLEHALELRKVQASIILPALVLILAVIHLIVWRLRKL